MKEHDYIVQCFLRELRAGMARKDLNNQQLAAALKISPGRIGRLLSGKVPLKLPLLLKICRRLEMNAGRTLTTAIEHGAIPRRVGE